MKRSLLTAFFALIAAAASAETIRVGVSAGSHAQIMEQVAIEAKKLGLDIKIVEFSDYVIPNQALAQKDLDANSFQHEPYLNNQIAKTGWKLTKVGNTVTSPMGVYSQKYKDFADAPAGGRIGIPNDPTNGARALMLFASKGAITLRAGAGVTASPLDIQSNPKKYKFIELDAAQLPRSLPDMDAAAINSNYAVQAGLDPMRGAILLEALEGPWVNIVVTREEDKEKPWVATLMKAYRSEPVKSFVLEKFKGAYVPSW